MAISLKLVTEEIEDRMVQVLKFVKDDDTKNVIDVAVANKEGFTLDEATLERLKLLVQLGQRYEEISKSQKLEFNDL